MEKAMQSAHGVGYEVYMRKHSIRMKVEKRREQDYIRSKQMIADINSYVHTGNQ